MGHADSRTRLIDVLAASPTGTIIINAYIVHIKIDFYVFCFGQYGNRSRRRVDTAACFRNGDTLYAMYARFIFQLAIDAMAFDRENNFLESAQFRCIGTDDAGFPAGLLFDVFHIHAE